MLVERSINVKMTMLTKTKTKQSIKLYLSLFVTFHFPKHIIIHVTFHFKNDKNSNIKISKKIRTTACFQKHKHKNNTKKNTIIDRKQNENKSKIDS